MNDNLEEPVTLDWIAGRAFDKNKDLLELEEIHGYSDEESELLMTYSWETLPLWHKEFYLQYMELILNSPEFSTPEQIQDLWIARWEKEGWTVGEVLDPAKKTNPYLDKYREWSEDRKKRATVCFIVANYYRRKWERENKL